MAVACLIPVMAVVMAIIVAVVVTMLVVFIVSVVAAVTTAIVIAMLFAVARRVFTGVPAILDKIHSLAARIIGAAVFRPMLGVAQGYSQINRLLLNVTRRTFNDDRLRVDDARLRKVANINASVKTRLTNIDRYTYVGRHGRRCQREQACCKNDGFHKWHFYRMKKRLAPRPTQQDWGEYPLTAWISLYCLLYCICARKKHCRCHFKCNLAQ